MLYVVVGVLLSYITVNEEPNQPEDVAIYILTNGVHTDIVMPVKTKIIDWSTELKYSQPEKANSNYSLIAIGWGDKGFYLQTPTWADLKFSTAFKAATGTGSTAIHTTYYRNVRETKNCRKIMISWAQYEQLVSFINASFQKNETGHFIKIDTDANYGVTDAFYEATGSYSLFKTCNTWANSALKESGQRACLWTALDSSIFDKYE